MTPLLRILPARICLMVLYLLFFLPLTLHASDDDAIDFLDDDLILEGVSPIEIADPLEGFNRAMFEVNDFSYVWVFEPVATGYSYVIPDGYREAINNFFYNLQEPVRCLNALLQGRFSDAGTLLVRFVINSTGGVFGLCDPAGRDFDFQAVDATLGETLGSWGVGDGFYLVVPFFGPSTLREFTGDMVDGLALSPYYTWTSGWEDKALVYMGKDVTKLSVHPGEYESLKEMSFDPYVALRNVYMQNRKQLRDYTPANE